MTSLQESRTAPGVVGAAAYKRKVALGVVVRSLLVALSAGVLQQTTKGFFVLPTRAELAPPTPTVPAPQTDAAIKEAIGKELALQLANHAAARRGPPRQPAG